MTKKNTFYIKFYETIDERMSIRIYSCLSDQECEHFDLGTFDILYRAFVAVLYNFNVVKVNIEDDRYFLLKIETEKSIIEVCRIIKEFFYLFIVGS